MRIALHLDNYPFMDRSEMERPGTSEPNGLGATRRVADCGRRTIVGRLNLDSGKESGSVRRLHANNWNGRGDVPIAAQLGQVSIRRERPSP